LIRLVNRELELLNTYFKVNKLSLNVDKTVFMVFTSARKKKNDANVVDNRILLINDKPLQQVSSTKFLGVYINKHLNWADHIHQLEIKISKTCGFLSKLKYLLPQSVLLTIYNTLCLPYLQYCAIIWSGSINILFKDILTIQKRHLEAHLQRVQPFMVVIPKCR